MFSKISNKHLVLGLISVFVIILAYIYVSGKGEYTFLQDKTVLTPPVTISPEVLIPENGIVEFTGTLTDYNDGCIVDEQCIAYVDGYSIITNPGMVMPRVTLGQNSVNSEDIGKIVKVRAKHIQDKELTIEGDESLYILKVEE